MTKNKKIKKDILESQSFFHDDENIEDLLNPDTNDDSSTFKEYNTKLTVLTEEIYQDQEDDDYYTRDEKQSTYMMQKIHLKVSERNKKLSELIDYLKQLMTDGDSVAIIVPRINEIIDVQVKNDALLLKMFEILKRTSVEKHKLLIKERGSSSSSENEEFDFDSSADHTDINVDY
jgi:UDP-N-acetylglucosamine 2-epimerase